jgi:hypothetical protein
LEATDGSQTLSLRRYTLLVTGVAASSLLVAWSLGLGGRDTASRWATLYGGALAVLNAVAAYFLVVWSDRRPTSVFFRVVLWGTAGRMAALVGAVAAGILVLGLPRLPLVVSVLAYFVVFLALELTILHRRVAPVPGGSR